MCIQSFVLFRVRLQPVTLGPFGADRAVHDLADAIPEHLRLADLEGRLRRILALERLADRDGKSVDPVLARELFDVVSAHSEYLATAIPGFTAALRWPE